MNPFAPSLAGVRSIRPVVLSVVGDDGTTPQWGQATGPIAASRGTTARRTFTPAVTGDVAIEVSRDAVRQG